MLCSIVVVSINFLKKISIVVPKSHFLIGNSFTYTPTKHKASHSPEESLWWPLQTCHWRHHKEKPTEKILLRRQTNQSCHERYTAEKPNRWNNIVCHEPMPCHFLIKKEINSFSHEGIQTIIKRWSGVQLVTQHDCSALSKV